MNTGTRVSFQIWTSDAKTLTTQTGTVVKIYKGSDPLVLITADRNELRMYPTMPLKVRISGLTEI